MSRVHIYERVHMRFCILDPLFHPFLLIFGLCTTSKSLTAIKNILRFCGSYRQNSFCNSLFLKWQILKLKVSPLVSDQKREIVPGLLTPHECSMSVILIVGYRAFFEKHHFFCQLQISNMRVCNFYLGR